MCQSVPQVSSSFLQSVEATLSLANHGKLEQKEGSTADPRGLRFISTALSSLVPDLYLHILFWSFSYFH